MKQAEPGAVVKVRHCGMCEAHVLTDEPPREWDRFERSFWCADCEEAPATVFLPEGRYLCRPCWTSLRALRAQVVAGARTPAAGRTRR